MKKFCSAAFGAALAYIAAPALAADIYAADGLKDSPIAVSGPSWTGFYIGLGGGGGAVNHDLKASIYDLGGELNGIGGDGGFGTVEVGYDQQFGRFVAGVYFNFDFTGIGSKLSVGSGGESFNASYDLDYLWSAGGRLGYLVNRSTLAYVLAGYSQGHFSVSPSNSYVGSQTYDGFNIGGGLETALSGNWFLKAEYRYTDLGTQTLFNVPGLKITDQADIHEGRVVLSYKFGSAYEPLK